MEDGDTLAVLEKKAKKLRKKKESQCLCLFYSLAQLEEMSYGQPYLLICRTSGCSQVHTKTRLLIVCVCFEHDCDLGKQNLASGMLTCSSGNHKKATKEEVFEGV